jgi:hypothetical protein
MRRVGYGVGSSGVLSPSSLSTAALAFRRVSTGKLQSEYQPGPVVRLFRYCYQTACSDELKKRVAQRMYKRMQKAEQMEKDAMWLKRHGSPLKVMGLPEHAALVEVKAKYKELIFETHPDIGKAEADPAAFQLVQKAYAMVMDKNSMYYVNGCGSHLLAEINPLPPMRSVPAYAWFAVGCWAFAFMVFVVFTVVVAKRFWLWGLWQFDPEFFQFMLAREEEEAAMIARGEYVDPDKSKQQPLKMQLVTHPGRFIHSDATETPLP